MMTTEKLLSKQTDALLAELRILIESARQRVAQTANSTLTILYWHVGLRIGITLIRCLTIPSYSL